MKNKISIFLIPALLLTAILLFSCDNPVEDEIKPYMQKYNLSDIQEKIVEDILYQKIDKITEEDMLKVKTITIAGKNAEASNNAISETSSDHYKFSGKTYEYNESYGNELSVLGIFENLEELQILYAPDLNDISFLSNLKNLKSINITMTNIKDFTFLEGLEKLTAISIYNCPVEKIKFNQNNAIEGVTIVGSFISNASVFNELNKSINKINISFNKIPIDNLNTFQKFNELIYLFLGAPELDISFLKDWNTNIENLGIGGTDNLDLNNIVHFGDTLTYLEIFDTDGIDLTPVDEFENLNNIYLLNVKNPIRGTKTQQGNDILTELDFTFNFFSWFEYD